MAMELEGVEGGGGGGGGGNGGNEGEGEMTVFMDQPVLGTYQSYYDDQNTQQQPRPATPPPTRGKGLPWTPKVRQKDVDAFLEVSRLKFVGYKLDNDSETLAGLPQPIHEGVNTLKRVSFAK